jgi:hypothetical protein
MRAKLQLALITDSSTSSVGERQEASSNCCNSSLCCVLQTGGRNRR